MSFWRKKPVVIEAKQLDNTNADEILTWGSPQIDYYHATTGTLYIKTREGLMTASKGDWIIKGIAGEFYPCKPDIFAATYESVKDETVKEE